MSIEGNVKDVESLKSLRGKIASIPQVDETLTKKGYSADAKVVGDALEERVKKKDVIDNLNSDDKESPLSANQGRQIRKMLEDINLSEAGTVGYNNATSGLTATNMQTAIDEVVELTNSALPKSGGMVDGVLHVRSANNGYASLHKNNTESTDYGLKVVDRTKDNKNAYMTIRALTDELTFTNTKGETEAILHEGNKPFGSYEGNGNANERVIDTKGIGRLILVYNPNYFSFVFPEGAFVIKTSDKSFDFFPSTKAYYLNGKLTLNLTNDALNKTGETYYYQAV